jgi:hypothetical protein
LSLLNRVLGGGEGAAEGAATAEGMPSGLAALNERAAAEQGAERLVKLPEELSAEAQSGRAMEAATQGAKPRARLAGMVRAGRGDLPRATNEEIQILRRRGGLGPGAAHYTDPEFTAPHDIGSDIPSEMMPPGPVSSATEGESLLEQVRRRSIGEAAPSAAGAVGERAPTGIRQALPQTLWQKLSEEAKRAIEASGGAVTP